MGIFQSKENYNINDDFLKHLNSKYNDKILFILQYY